MLIEAMGGGFHMGGGAHKVVGGIPDRSLFNRGGGALKCHGFQPVCSYKISPIEWVVATQGEARDALAKP